MTKGRPGTDAPTVHDTTPQVSSQQRYLERKPYRQLHLPGITHAESQEPAEIEKRGPGQRVDVVSVVESIEHLDDRY